MEVRLAKENYYLTKDGKFNQKEALKTAGIKAAVCFKPGEITPWDIRDNESERVLLRRGIDTVLADHVTPSQQVPVSLEIYEIPKIICMYLNNLGMQAADERSLRYTEVKANDYLTEVEISLYSKWMDILQQILWKDYQAYFMMSNGNDEKRAKSAIKKLAQENARSFITVFMPTSLTYTCNFSELNKLALQMERTINAADNTELETLAVPYLQDFLNQLKKLKVIITNEDVWAIDSELAQELRVPRNSNYLYKDTKLLDLNLFAHRNKFSGINLPDEYGVSFHVTREISFSGFAQLQRHRTVSTEMEVLENPNFFVPQFLEPYPELIRDWLEDARRVRVVCYPQGEKIKVSMDGTLKNLVSYVGSERACNRAQFEISKFYMELIEDYYKALVEKADEWHCNPEVLKPYLGMYRCRTKNYKCTAPCPGGPNPNRKF